MMIYLLIAELQRLRAGCYDLRITPENSFSLFLD
jgi:hypothetical protein